MNHNLQLQLFLLGFLFSFDAALSDPDYLNPDPCKPQTCGGLQNITYPFWVEQSQQSYCGVPDFKLNCTEDDKAVLTVSGETYYVQNIFYNNRSVVLSNTRFFDDNCKPPQDLSFPPPFQLNSSTNTHIQLFEGCNSSLVGSLGLLQICPGVIAVPDDYYVNLTKLVGECNYSVLAPVWSLEIGESIDGYLQKLKDGFLLDWDTTSMCVDGCVPSGGRCGYNISRNSAICLCKDRVHYKECSEKSTTKKVVFIVVPSAVGVSLIALVIIFLCRRHKKRKSVPFMSSETLSRSVSSEPSSKRDPELGSALHPTHIFSYKELQEATDNFNASRELGDGGFGTVYKGKLRDGRIVAVKRLYENNYKRVEQFLNEVAILNRLRHTNLVSLYGCTSRHSRELLLVYEYVPNGTVADHLHGDLASEKFLAWPIRMSIAIETAEALAYLHAVEPQIIHRDVKTNNILLDNNFRVKVADFGLSRLFPVDATHVSTAPQGTPGYVDPEYHQCYQLTDKSDVYSFGVVLVELISSKPAVDITRHRHEINLANLAINKIHNHSLHELVDPEIGFESDDVVKRMVTMVAELAFQCLQAEKEMRPSMDEVLEALKTINSGGYELREVEEEDVNATPTDDSSLLKNNHPCSPDSVVGVWPSKSTTPNTSG
ncbi:putative serine/threonine-protein kinase [Acorus calamus]|uniref:non-specific serine/threonine protein kinase n=1 Tax=Acorus calamus TaxID=4465 RepID=A0AAV9D878_ACOCL|nr:putative serine/threonine-protein kinase [Acorus calamus]